MIEISNVEIRKHDPLILNIAVDKLNFTDLQIMESYEKYIDVSHEQAMSIFWD